MNQTPLVLEGTWQNPYGGFGLRLASLLLDAIISMPIGFLLAYLNSAQLENYYYTVVPSLLIGLWYHVYLPKVYGGTPGKLIVGLKIIRIDGGEIGWKEAFLRYSVTFGITLFSVVLMIKAISLADSQTHESLSWLQQSTYLMSLVPAMFLAYNVAIQLWTWSELVVLLTNPRRRAVHDYIAGTVIIKKIFEDRIREEMKKPF